VNGYNYESQSPVYSGITVVDLSIADMVTMIGPRTPDSTDVAAGQRIRVERISRRMSLTELAEEIGVSFQQLQKYESGLNRVGVGRLNRIAEALGIPVRAFFEGSQSTAQKNEDGKTSPLEMLSQPGAVRVLRAFTGLPRGPLKQAVLDLLEIMAGLEQSGDE